MEIPMQEFKNWEDALMLDGPEQLKTLLCLKEQKPFTVYEFRGYRLDHVYIVECQLETIAALMDDGTNYITDKFPKDVRIQPFLKMVKKAWGVR